MPTIALPDGPLHVTDAGSGLPLVLVHGFPLDHRMWQHQIESLSTSCRVIAPDLRGFGQSPPAKGETVTMQEFAGELIAMLDELKIGEPVVLCGLSMGGYIAWEFVEQAAERLRGLILCDTRAAADSADAAAQRLMNADRVLREGPEFLAEGMPEKLFSEVTREDQPEIVSKTQEVIRGTSREGIAAALRGMAERADVRDRLAGITLRTLLVCGEEDAISPPEEMRAIAEGLPEARFEVIARAGHMAPLEQPEAVNAVIREFLEF